MSLVLTSPFSFSVMIALPSLSLAMAGLRSSLKMNLRVLPRIPLKDAVAIPLLARSGRKMLSQRICIPIHTKSSPTGTRMMG